MRERVGIFGGTFDPIHYGHLHLAEAALSECNLERIVFIPAAMPPHKPASNLTPFMHRVEMLKLALQSRDCYQYSLIEAELPPPTYTIDTLRYIFSRSSAADTEYFFLTGLDAFLEITTWKEYNELLRMVSFIVSEREEESHVHLKSKIALELGYLDEDHIWSSDVGKKPVYFLRDRPLAISSSTIRRKVHCGESINGMVPDAICKYIEMNALYR